MHFAGLLSNHRAWAIVLRIISYNRILAFDEIGDIYNTGPHLLVEYSSDGEPFEQHRSASLLLPVSSYVHNIILQEEGKHISFFPSEIPEQTIQSLNNPEISSDSL